MVINKPTHPNDEIHNYIEKCINWKFQPNEILSKNNCYWNEGKRIILIKGPQIATLQIGIFPIKLLNLKYKEFIFTNPRIVGITNSYSIYVEYHIQIDEIKRIN